MTGKEFKEMRILWGLSLSDMQKIFGIGGKTTYRHYEIRENKPVPLLFEIFFNYVNRYGLQKAKLEFLRRFKI